ncbi:MAG: hypothetical protein KDA44_12240 [Planctomycetales bacterium]|nr:hypothetical protein [Planctomycetales bacterium]
MFVVLCVAPTLATLAFVVVKLRPGRDGRWSRAAAAQLLTPVTITGAVEPRPGVVECSAVVVGDRRRQPVLEFTDLRGQLAHGGGKLHAARVELHLENLSAAVDALEQWLADDAPASEALIDEVVLTRPTDALPGGKRATWATLRDVRLRTQSRTEEGAAGRELVLQGKLARSADCCPGWLGTSAASPPGVASDSAAAEDSRWSSPAATHDSDPIADSASGDDGLAEQPIRIQLAIRRDAVRRLLVQATLAESADEAETEATQFQATIECLPAADDCDDVVQIVVDEPELDMPGWVLGGWPGFDDASLRGTIRGTLHAGRPAAGSFQGTVTGFAPAALLETGGPHEFHGLANLNQFSLQWTPTGCTAASGDVEIASARVSRSLARCAVTPLWCVAVGAAPGELASEGPELLPIDKIAFGFELSADHKLSIGGQCGASGDPSKLNTLAVREGRPWLLEPKFVQIPQSTWGKFLSPDAGDPATAPEGAHAAD